ncbi:LysR substrate-binding domain-containing protein [Brucella cytisi]|uniref:LysR substrate-binding domain-containing protein n=1 Tax=Brucella cytisi TaxID=407152 RepID=UPI00313C4B07
MTQLRAGKLDVAFAVGTPDLSGYRPRRVWTEHLVAVLPVHHPLGSFRSRLHQRQRLHRLFQKDDRV